MPESGQPFAVKLTAAVLTVSDSCARGERRDVSGPAVTRILKDSGFEIVATEVVADDQPAIQDAIVRLAGQARLVLTVGGTGIAPRDVTPEATRAVCGRLVEGVGERMRAEGGKSTPYAALTRAVCGVRGQSLVVNLPGSPSGATEALNVIVGLFPHALDLLQGKTAHARQR